MIRPVARTAAPGAPAALAPAEALARLRQRPLRDYADTSLSEAPFWFAFTPADSGGKPAVVEFPSRHAVELACWDAQSLRPLGQSARGRSEGAMSPVKSGFALAVAACFLLFGTALIDIMTVSVDVRRIARDYLPFVIFAPLLGVFAFDLAGRTAYLYSLATLFLLFLLARRLVASPFGLSLRAIRDNRDARMKRSEPVLVMRDRPGLRQVWLMKR